MGSSIINWIEQWLTDRRQSVDVNGEVSSWKSVLSGIPQASVLGHIIFLVYINDLEEWVTSKILKFSDDTKLFRKTTEIGDTPKLKVDIGKLVRWCYPILGNINVYTRRLEILARTMKWEEPYIRIENREGKILRAAAGNLRPAGQIRPTKV